MNQKIKHIIQPVAASVMLFTLAACSPSDENTADKSETKSAAQASSDFPYVFEKVANNTWVMHGPRELPN